MAGMVALEDMSFNDMEELEESTNAEHYLEVTEDGVVVDDREDIERTQWKFKGPCPFPGCTDPAWNRVKKHLWSVEDPVKVLQYVKHHGKYSTLHGQHPTSPMPLDRVYSCLVDCKAQIKAEPDTYKDRQSYRLDNKKRKEEKDKAEQEERDGKRKWKKGKDDWGSGWGESPPSGGSSSAWGGVDPNVVNVSNQVAQLAHTVQSLAQRIDSGPPVAAGTAHDLAVNSAVPGFISRALDDAQASGECWDQATLQRVSEKHITLPYSQLLLIKETVTRAKEASKSSMAACMTPLNQLRTDIGILANTESVLEELLEQGKR